MAAKCQYFTWKGLIFLGNHDWPRAKALCQSNSSENQHFPREILSYFTGHWVYSYTLFQIGGIGSLSYPTTAYCTYLQIALTLVLESLMQPHPHAPTVFCTRFSTIEYDKTTVHTNQQGTRGGDLPSDQNVTAPSTPTSYGRTPYEVNVPLKN